MEISDLAPDKKRSRKNDTPTSSTYSTPRKQKLSATLKWTQNKVNKQKTKIKRLQTQNRRLKLKIKTLHDILLPLQEKFGMTNENIVSLENTNVEVCCNC